MLSSKSLLVICISEIRVLFSHHLDKRSFADHHVSINQRPNNSILILWSLHATEKPKQALCKFLSVCMYKTAGDSGRPGKRICCDSGWQERAEPRVGARPAESVLSLARTVRQYRVRTCFCSLFMRKTGGPISTIKLKKISVVIKRPSFLNGSMDQHNIWAKPLKFIVIAF